MNQLQQDNSHVEAWLSIVSAYKTMHVLLNQELVKSGLTFPQYRVLRALGRFGPMPMSKIGEHMLVTPANITGIVDRLEERGYVERSETDADRRIITMTLTAKGITTFQKTTDRHRELVGRIMATLDPREMMELIGVLQRIKDAALRERNVVANEGDSPHEGNHSRVES